MGFIYSTYWTDFSWEWNFNKFVSRLLFMTIQAKYKLKIEFYVNAKFTKNTKSKIIENEEY